MLDSPLTPTVATEISEAILSAPGWCRVGITAPSEDLRKRSARELALAIVGHLNPTPADAADQLPLAL